MKRRAALPALALVVAGCQRTPAPAVEPRAVTAPRVVVAPPRTVYTVAAPGPGRVRGHVRWDGARVALPALPVPSEARREVCGDTQTPPVLRLDAQGNIAGAVVALGAVSAGKPLPTEVPTVDQRGCQYDPTVLAVTVGQRVRFTSSDPAILHTVHGYFGYRDGAESWFNRATPRGASALVEVEREGVHTVYCDSGHPWMTAFVLAFPHPYFAVTDSAGTFAIDGIPAGTFSLRLWHEGYTPGAPDANGRPTYGPAVTAEVPITVTNAAPSATAEFVLSAAGARAQLLDGGR